MLNFFHHPAITTVSLYIVAELVYVLSWRASRSSLPRVSLYSVVYPPCVLLAHANFELKISNNAVPTVVARIPQSPTTMPSHTTHSALIQMSLAMPGAPWCYPKWQEITGIHHGLFPADDAQLPRGWSRDVANFIQSYFDQYSKKKKEDDKIKFSAARAGAHQVPGRDPWRQWVVEMWKVWDIHGRITRALAEEGLHPMTLSLGHESNAWPDGTLYTPLAVDSVARSLFGDEALGPHGRAHEGLRRTIQALIQRTWLNLKKQGTRSKVRILDHEKIAIAAFESELMLSFVVIVSATDHS